VSSPFAAIPKSSASSEHALSANTPSTFGKAKSVASGFGSFSSFSSPFARSQTKSGLSNVVPAAAVGVSASPFSTVSRAANGRSKSNSLGFDEEDGEEAEEPENKVDDFGSMLKKAGQGSATLENKPRTVYTEQAGNIFFHWS